MSESDHKTMDPRVRRTRQLLHEAMIRLLEVKDFDEISVQDITDEATVNRATFYDHYPDKAALFTCVVAARFHASLDARGVTFGSDCGSAIFAIVLGVCDYLADVSSSECGRHRALDPHLESAVINVVKGLILNGLRRHGAAAGESLEMIGGMVSWAIYGGAREWLEAPNRAPSEQAAATIVNLVKPILMTLGEGGAAEEVAARSLAAPTGHA